VSFWEEEGKNLDKKPLVKAREDVDIYIYSDNDGWKKDWIKNF